MQRYWSEMMKSEYYSNLSSSHLGSMILIYIDFEGERTKEMKLWGNESNSTQQDSHVKNESSEFARIQEKHKKSVIDSVQVMCGRVDMLQSRKWKHHKQSC